MDDAEVVKAMLTGEFQQDFDVVKCRRLGRPHEGKVQPVLVTLDSEQKASFITQNSRQLRQSLDETIRKSVFINPDLTRTEAFTAYQNRCERRQRQQNQTGKPSSSSSSSSSSAVQSSAAVTVPPPAPTAAVLLPSLHPTVTNLITTATAAATTAAATSVATTLSPTATSFVPTSSAAEADPNSAVGNVTSISNAAAAERNTQ